MIKIESIDGGTIKSEIRGSGKTIQKEVLSIVLYLSSVFTEVSGDDFGGFIQAILANKADFDEDNPELTKSIKNQCEESRKNENKKNLEDLMNDVDKVKSADDLRKIITESKQKEPLERLLRAVVLGEAMKAAFKKSFSDDVEKYFENEC